MSSSHWVLCVVDAQLLLDDGIGRRFADREQQYFLVEIEKVDLTINYLFILSVKNFPIYLEIAVCFPLLSHCL